MVMLLVPVLVACSGAKQQTGYSDSKCFNLCVAGQTCLLDPADKRFHCSDKALECAPPCEATAECKNVAGVPTCVPKPTVMPAPKP